MLRYNLVTLGLALLSKAAHTERLSLSGLAWESESEEVESTGERDLETLTLLATDEDDGCEIRAKGLCLEGADDACAATVSNKCGGGANRKCCLNAPPAHEYDDSKCAAKGGVCVEGAESMCEDDTPIEANLCGGGSERKCCFAQPRLGDDERGVDPADEFIPAPVSPWTGEEIKWAKFVPWLVKAQAGTYKLRGSQICEMPPLDGWTNRATVGCAYNNCVTFTFYLIGNVFAEYGFRFNVEDYRNWMNIAGTGMVPYGGYGVRVLERWGVAARVPMKDNKGRQPASGWPKPVNGVYVIQTLSRYGGHSWMILDYDPDTDKILTLESNGPTDKCPRCGLGMNGIGAQNLGSLRDLKSLKDWKTQVKSWTTFQRRNKNNIFMYMARLPIDHQSVRDWIAQEDWRTVPSSWLFSNTARISA